LTDVRQDLITNSTKQVENHENKAMVKILGKGITPMPLEHLNRFRSAI
jgi:hypothetical protein